MKVLNASFETCCLSITCTSPDSSISPAPIIKSSMFSLSLKSFSSSILENSLKVSSIIGSLKLDYMNGFA